VVKRNMYFHEWCVSINCWKAKKINQKGGKNYLGFRL